VPKSWRGARLRRDTNFRVRYLTDDPVPVRDIIESLRGIETVLTETGRLLPKFVDGLIVEGIEIKVREIAQESPLRELFLLTLIVAFQEDLEGGVTEVIEAAAGYVVPANLEALVTVVALIVLFYGVGTVRDLVMGPVTDGPARRKLKGLIQELSDETGKTPEQIEKVLDARYGEPTMMKRVANAASRFFTPSKRFNSAPIEVNNREIDHETVQDIPAPYLIEHEQEFKPTRNFFDVELELHAQDKDHAGRGWAAMVEGVTEKRIRLKLMDDVDPSDLWNKNRVRGDVTIKYERLGDKLNPIEIQLHQIVKKAA
jgi:hypothetical protein